MNYGFLRIATVSVTALACMFLFIENITTNKIFAFENTNDPSITYTPIIQKHAPVLDTLDSSDSSRMRGQLNRLQLLEQGLEPILPGPEKTELEELIKKLGSASTNDAISKYEEDIGEWKYKLFARLDNIRLHCGLLCQLNSLEKIEEYTDPELGGDVIPSVVVPNVDCDAILALEDIDAGDMTFPAVIPEELQDFYSLNETYGFFRWDKLIRKDAYLEGEAEKSLWPTGNVWNEDDINEAVKAVEAKTFKGSYGVDEVNTVRESLLQGVAMEGKSVLVIGSSHPWIEAICLSLGAKLVTTLEYGEIISNHPQIKTETPSTIRKQYLEGSLEKFDGIITHSSLEHSGLGRYGDALNPWGDILAVARGWCITQPKGFMWIAVPTGRDRVFYNWHRIYGPKRWPLLGINWRQVGKDVTWTTVDEHFGRGIWRSMANTGFIFEKIEPRTE